MYNQVNAGKDLSECAATFLTFQITVEEQTAVLNITGLDGTKEFLKNEVDL